MAVAKLKSEDLVQRVGALLDSGSASELELARLRAEAEKIAKADPVGYQIMRGFMSVLEGDEKLTRAAFDIALRLHPTDWQVPYNYSLALTHLGERHQALELARKAYDLDPNNTAVLGRIMFVLVSLGRFREIQIWMKRRNELFPDQPFPNSAAVGAVSEYLTERGISDDAVEVGVECANKIAKAHKLRTIGHEFQVQEDEEQRWMSFGILVEASPTVVADVNEELAESIVQLGIKPDVLMAINVMFLPA